MFIKCVWILLRKKRMVFKKCITCSTTIGTIMPNRSQKHIKTRKTTSNPNRRAQNSTPTMRIYSATMRETLPNWTSTLFIKNACSFSKKSVVFAKMHKMQHHYWDYYAQPKPNTYQNAQHNIKSEPSHSTIAHQQ